MTTALVTGSSTGIGYATALRLAREGAQVIATMRDPHASDLDEVAAREGLSIELAPLDVTSDAGVATVFEDVTRRYGPLDVLVANAGVGGSGGAVETTSLDVFRETMETNFFGALRCVKAVVPGMRSRGRGTIIATSSQAGRIAFPMMSAYVASKWALEGAMESLAASLSPFGVRVVIIEPGTILTPIFGKGDLGDSPDYADLATATVGMMMHDITHGSDPEVVADCIANAITSDAPHLRYLVGQGAERNVRVREELGDDGFVSLWAQPAETIVASLLAGEM